ncbi:MAG: hypothetical protein AAF826_09450 [Pseudomonadota bacterium]
MSDKKAEDVTLAWAASEEQKSKAKKLRIFAWISWAIALAGEGAGIWMLLQGMFDQGNLGLLIGLLVGIALFAILGNIWWKKANRQDPASRSEPFKFFVQNQLGAIITMIAFLPLIVLIFMDKDMDPKNKKVAGGIGAVLAVVAVLIGVEFDPASIEEYTVDMNECATQIKAGQATTSCSPEVAEQALEIARDTEVVQEATATADNPNGQDVVYWITPPEGEERHDSPRVFHLCADVSPMRGKPVSSGTVTEAYADNAARITKQITMERRQCGFGAE